MSVSVAVAAAVSVAVSVWNVYQCRFVARWIGGGGGGVLSKSAEESPIIFTSMVEVANFRTSVTKNKKVTKKEEYEHQARALGIKHVRQDLLTRSSF